MSGTYFPVFCEFAAKYRESYRISGGVAAPFVNPVRRPAILLFVITPPAPVLPIGLYRQLIAL
jgi:hypothetical protein